MNISAWFGRAFFGELGDKTFWLTLVLVAWCPWEGVRNCDGSQCQQFTVIGAVVLSLWARCALLVVLPEWRSWDGAFEWVTFALLVFMLPKAYRELGRTADEEKERERLRAAGMQHSSGTSKPGGLPSSLMGTGASAGGRSSSLMGTGASSGAAGTDDPEDDSKTYGAADLGRPAHGDDTNMFSTILCLVIPLCLIFCCEAEDKSEITWLTASGPSHQDEMIAAFFGVVPAVLCAGVLGFILERQCSDNKVNFAVFGLLTMLSLVELSQAALHLPMFAQESTEAVKSLHAQRESHSRLALVGLLDRIGFGRHDS